MDNIIHPFQLPIYTSKIPKEDFNVIKQDTSEYIKKNINNFSLPFDCPTLSTINVEREKNIQSLTLENQITFHLQKYWEVWKFQTNLNLYIEEIWVNIAKKGAYQEIHHHEDSFFSGILYIDVTNESGNLQFLNPLSSEGILMKNPLILEKEYPIIPTNGLLVLFPGWLPHRVQVNNLDNERISLSFNIKNK